MMQNSHVNLLPVAQPALEFYMTTYAPITTTNAAHIDQISEMRCGFITDIAWSPDGQTLAVANGGGVALWEGGFGGAPTRTLDVHDGPVKAVAFSSDGYIMATASADTTVKLSVVASAQAVSVLRGHSDAVNAVVFSSDGALLASAGADRTIRVLDLSQTARRDLLTGHGDEIMSLDMTGRLLASGSRDGTVRLWRGQDSVGVLSGHLDWVREVAFSPDGTLLASSSRDGSVRLWDVATQTTRAVLPHDGDSRAVTFSPDGTVVATDNGGVILLWDVASGEQLARLEGHEKPVLSLAFHPVGNLLVSGSGDNTLKLWAVAAD